MGNTTPPPKCFFTNLETKPTNSEFDGIEYQIEVNGINVELKLNWDLERLKQSLSSSEKLILKGDLLNYKKSVKLDFTSEDLIRKFILQSNAPKTPLDKLNLLFITLHNLQNYEGDELNFFKLFHENYLWEKLYLKNIDEFEFYINTLADKRLLSNVQKNNVGYIISAQITFEGLNYMIDLFENGINSKNCFIAMSFGSEMNEIREIIREVVDASKHSPIFIDEVHYEPELTINDAIISNIKKSKFCICDFTEQKNGVYFECGFALGRGMKVIYTCREDDFKKSHFDTNHFPHIIYKNTDELKQKLTDKIEAWID